MTGRAMALFGLLCVAGTAGATDRASPPADPKASEVLEHVGFGADDRAHVLKGEILVRNLAAASEHDLAVALAFLVKLPPDALARRIIEEGFVVRDDPNTLAYGRLPDPAGIADFEALTLPEKERELYATASAGENVNLSLGEITALRREPGGPAAAERRMRTVLLGRLHAYRQRGLDGIAPYERGGGRRRDPGADLRRAARAAPNVAGLDADLAHFLDAYPNARLPDYEPIWHWTRYDAAGDPALILTHSFAARLGQGRVVVQRQFYVSRGYNAEQAIAVFVPVSEGTLAVYWNHTSTDRVAGRGGSIKRAVGQRLMGRQLETLYRDLRQSVTE